MANAVQFWQYRRSWQFWQFRSFFWRKVSLPRSYLEFLVIRGDGNGPELAIGQQGIGLIRNRVLAAQFTLNLIEGVGQVVQFERKEGASSGGVRQNLQVLVA